MVVAARADLYAPFLHGFAEDGVQSSEEGSSSDIHSPIFEAPYPPEVRYHLGHPPLPDASSLGSAFDARYHSPHAVDVQAPAHHLLETLQAPSTGQVLLPSPPHASYVLQHHPVLPVAAHVGLSPPLGVSPPALNPADGYAFDLSHRSISAHHMRAEYEPSPSTSRAAFVLPMSESKPPSNSSSRPSPSGKGNASGSNAQPGPSRHRREASSVVIACRQCRGRKIRCDSTRPVCNNCTRRGNECEYDAKPKRRGPDKHPGTRQRSCKRRASETEPSGASPQAKKRRKIEDDHDGDLLSFDEREGVVNGARRPLLAPASPIPHTARGQQAPPLILDTSVQSRGTASGSIYPKDGRSPISQHSPLYTYDAMDPARFTARVDPRMPRHEERRCVPVAFPPEVGVPGGAWWDILLSRYPSAREEPYQDICADLKFLLENTGYWLIFLDRNTFLDRLADANFRASIEPSLILSALALSNLMQSSEVGRGEAGRNLAVGLRNAAQSSLEAACNASRLHYTLAEAAIVLALFESSCHPDYSTTRANEALQFVDRIIRVLSLSMVDVGDRGVSGYQPRSIPIVYHEDRNYRTPARCSCVPSAHNASSAHNPPHHTVSWSFNPPWDPSWTEEECRKEEWRRVTWSALNIIASYTAQSAAFHEEPMDMFLTEPSNYILLFPGEAYERQPQNRIPGQSPKDSVWALYCRSMLIWLSCLPQRDSSWSTEERAEFAINAWHEIQAVQSALDIHHCNLDTAIMYVTREYLYNTRMAIADEFRRLQDNDLAFAGPMFNVRQAQEWIDYQAKIAQRAKDGILRVTEKPGKLLTQRPFQALWYMTQVAFCIVLWETEPSMTNALELAKSFFVILDALNQLWPCRAQQIRLDELRLKLSVACRNAGILLPEFTPLPGLTDHRS